MECKYVSPFKALKEKLLVAQAYRRLFDTPDGRIVLAHIMRNAGVTVPNLTSDPSQLQVDQGQRRLAHSIYRYAHGRDESVLLRMIEEATEKEQNPTSTS